MTTDSDIEAVQAALDAAAVCSDTAESILAFLDYISIHATGLDYVAARRLADAIRELS